MRLNKKQNFWKLSKNTTICSILQKKVSSDSLDTCKEWRKTDKYNLVHEAKETGQRKRGRHKIANNGESYGRKYQDT